MRTDTGNNDHNNENERAEALAAELGLPFIRLSSYRPVLDVIKIIPRATASRLKLIPLSISDTGELNIATSDPMDLPAADEIRALTGREVKVFVSSLSDIEENLNRIYNLCENFEEAITDARRDAETSSPSLTSDHAPVIALVNDIISRAVTQGASDIHVEPGDKVTRLRFRIDGQLHTEIEYPLELHPPLTSRIKIMSGMDIAESRRPQDGRILAAVNTPSGERRVDLRVSTLPTMNRTNREKIVLRILEKGSALIGLKKLGMDAESESKVRWFCGLPWGMVLVTGPTGSGKSTTLYSMLQRINKPNVNIVTVEDPIEFSIEGINQVQVNEPAGVTFESALRSILRQDPDKIMVGEIRDQETAQIAIRAAMTGHLVLSTLHTNDAPSAAIRLVNMGIPAFLVSAALSGVIAQRLVRRLCPRCREEYELDSGTCDMIGVPAGTRMFRPRGCEECRNGYRDRMGIYEIMIIDDDLRESILSGAGSVELRRMAVDKGMKTLRMAGVNAALGGYTSLEEVLSVTI